MLKFHSFKVTSFGLLGLVLVVFFTPWSWAAQMENIRSVIYMSAAIQYVEPNFKHARNTVYNQLSRVNQEVQASGRHMKLTVVGMADIPDFDDTDPRHICGELARRLGESRARGNRGPIGDNVWRLMNVNEAHIAVVVLHSSGRVESTFGRGTFACDGVSADTHDVSHGAPYVFVDFLQLNELSSAQWPK